MHVSQEVGKDRWVDTDHFLEQASENVPSSNLITCGLCLA